MIPMNCSTLCASVVLKNLKFSLFELLFHIFRFLKSCFSCVYKKEAGNSRFSMISNIPGFFLIYTNINEISIHRFNEPFLFLLKQASYLYHYILIPSPDYSIFDKNSLNLAFFGFSKTSSGVPSSAILPLSIKIILEATSFANPIS